MKTLLLLVAALAGCAPGIYRSPLRQSSYYSINADGSKSATYSRINEWTSYGTHGLGAQAAIAAAYEQAQHAPPPTNQVDIYNASLPPGVTLDHDLVKIEKGAPYEAIGRFEIGYWRSSAPHEAEIEPDLRRLARVAQGDTIVVEVQRLDHADDRVSYMTGLVLRKHGVPAAKPLGSTAPAPHHEHARAHLVYTATGAGCPSEDDFADEVSARLGYSPWQAAAPALRLVIGREDGAFYAKVSRPGSTPRTLSGASCRAAIDAAVAAVVVELDDGAHPTRPPAPPRVD